MPSRGKREQNLLPWPGAGATRCPHAEQPPLRENPGYFSPVITIKKALMLQGTSSGTARDGDLRGRCQEPVAARARAVQGFKGLESHLAQ